MSNTPSAENQSANKLVFLPSNYSFSGGEYYELVPYGMDNLLILKPYNEIPEVKKIISTPSAEALDLELIRIQKEFSYYSNGHDGMSLNESVEAIKQAIATHIIGEDLDRCEWRALSTDEAVNIQVILKAERDMMRNKLFGEKNEN